MQPIFFKGELVLFAARLQDYSHRLSRVVSFKPAQFCKSGNCFQYRVRLGNLRSARSLSQARIVDVTARDLDNAAVGIYASDTEETDDTVGGGAPGGGVPPRHVKRLGFGGLQLEPEYLLDRLRHECNDLGFPDVFPQDIEVAGTEVMRMEIHGPAVFGAAAGGSSADAGAPLGAAGAGGISGAAGMRAVVHVMPEDDEGTYAISLMRLQGDTFEFHSLYRKLRERLGDVTHMPPVPPLRASASAAAGRGASASCSAAAGPPSEMPPDGALAAAPNGDLPMSSSSGGSGGGICHGSCGNSICGGDVSPC